MLDSKFYTNIWEGGREKGACLEEGEQTRLVFGLEHLLNLRCELIFIDCTTLQGGRGGGRKETGNYLGMEIRWAGGKPSLQCNERQAQKVIKTTTCCFVPFQSGESPTGECVYTVLTTSFCTSECTELWTWGPDLDASCIRLVKKFLTLVTPSSISLALVCPCLAQ